MYYLALDCTVEASCRVALIDAAQHVEHVFEGRAQHILAYVDQMLARACVEKSALSGVAVVVGIGSFMSTRISATVANGLAHALHIPAVALAGWDETAYDTLSARFMSAALDARITPQYSGEPNIRLPHA